MIEPIIKNGCKLIALSVAGLAPFVHLHAQTETAEESAPAVDSEAFRVMGYAMASQLRLNIGFSDEELTAVFEGMRMAASGGDEPENFQSAVQRAQQIYMARMQVFQAAEQERIQKVADANKAEGEAFFAELDQREDIQKTDSGLRYKIIEPGEGDGPGANAAVVVNYRGTLIDGTEFDANENATFQVGRVVPGFSEGLQLLKPGGKIELYLPSEIAYGDRPSRPGSPIEPGDTLIFNVELLEVNEAPTTIPNMPPNLPANLPKPPPPPTTPPPPLPEHLRNSPPPAPPSGTPPGAPN